MALTALDIILLLAVGAGAVMGGLRGFVAEAMALLAWVAAVLAVRVGHDPVTAGLEPWVGTETGAAVLAFALVFGLVFLGVKLLGRSIGKQTRKSVLSPFDRLLGVGFGALKGLLLVTIGFLFVTVLHDVVYGSAAERPDWMTTSRTYPLIRASAEAVTDFVEERRAL